MRIFPVTAIMEASGKSGLVANAREKPYHIAEKTGQNSDTDRKVCSGVAFPRELSGTLAFGFSAFLPENLPDGKDRQPRSESAFRMSIRGPFPGPVPDPQPRL